MRALQMGHSRLQLVKLSLMQSLQNRWPHCGFIFVSVQVWRQIAHSNSSVTRSRRIWRGSRWGESDASTFVFIVICFQLCVCVSAVISYLRVSNFELRAASSAASLHLATASLSLVACTTSYSGGEDGAIGIRPRQSTMWMALLRPVGPHQERVCWKPHDIRKLTVTDGARDQVYWCSK